VCGHIEICKLFLAQGCDAFTYDHERQSASNISEAGWNRANTEIKNLKGLVHAVHAEHRKHVMASPDFLTTFLRCHAPVLRKFFARKTYELAGSLLHSLEAKEASVDEKRKTAELERQARKLRKMRRADYDPDATDSDESHDGEAGGPGGKSGGLGFNLYGAGPGGMRVSGKFKASYSYFDYLAATAGDEVALGGGNTLDTDDTGDDDEDGGARSTADQEGSRPSSSTPATPVDTPTGGSRSLALKGLTKGFGKDDHDSHDGGDEHAHDFDLTHVHLLRAFEALQAEVRVYSTVRKDVLSEERKKFGSLRDIITPGWRETRLPHKKKKKDRKTLEKDRLTIERKKLVSFRKAESAQKSEHNTPHDTPHGTPPTTA
jgi:hypothetical protein